MTVEPSLHIKSGGLVVDLQLLDPIFLRYCIQWNHSKVNSMCAKISGLHQTIFSKVNCLSHTALLVKEFIIIMSHTEYKLLDRPLAESEIHQILS